MTNFKQKRFVQTSLLVIIFVAFGLCFFSKAAKADATVTPATGGINISLDVSSQATGGGSFTTLGPITIAESALGEIYAGTSPGVHTFNLPAGWEFDTTVPATTNVNWELSGLMPLEWPTFTPSQTSFTITIASKSFKIPATISFSGLKVRPTGTVPTSGNITHSGSAITGVIGAASFGTLTSVAGSAKKIIINNPADATVGNTVSVTIEVQDQFGNKVASANDQAATVTVDGDAKISGVTTGAGDGTYSSLSETITSNSGQIVLTITDATAQTVNITTNHATLDHSSTQNVVFAAASGGSGSGSGSGSGGGSGSGSGSGGGSGSGSGSGGSSGGSSETTSLLYPLPTGAGIQTTNKKILSSSPDGTKIENNLMTVNAQGALAEVRVQSTISPATPLQDGQTITLETGAISEVKSVSLSLPSDCLQNISISSSGYASKVIASIVAQAAAAEQTGAEARDGMYLFGYKKFTILLNAKNNNLATLEKPVELSFDVSGIEYPQYLSIAWFDTAAKKWIDLGSVLNGTALSIETKKTGDFGIVRTLEQLRTVENIKAGRAEVLGIKINSEETQPETAQAASVTEAEYLAGAGDVNVLLATMSATRNIVQEKFFYDAHTKNLIKGLKNLTAANINSYTNFITYGSESAVKLGAGERAGVLNSYKAAFGKLPVSARDWQDVVNIATGHWTNERNTVAENKAKITFRAVYRREADLTNKYDDAAINILAYGLLSAKRNIGSEQTAIKTFKAVFRYNPKSTADWNSVRAIAYSGTKR